MDKRTAAQKKEEVAASITSLKAAMGRFIAAAESEDFTSMKKMLEVAAHEVTPAMENVVRAKTGVKYP